MLRGTWVTISIATGTTIGLTSQELGSSTSIPTITWRRAIPLTIEIKTANRLGSDLLPSRSGRAISTLSCFLNVRSNKSSGASFHKRTRNTVTKIITRFGQQDPVPNQQMSCAVLLGTSALPGAIKRPVNLLVAAPTFGPTRVVAG